MVTHIQYTEHIDITLEASVFQGLIKGLMISKAAAAAATTTTTTTTTTRKSMRITKNRTVSPIACCR